VRELGDALAYALTGEESTHELRRRTRVEIPPTQFSSDAEIPPTELSIETVPQPSPTERQASAPTIAGRFEPAAASDLVYPKAPVAASPTSGRPWMLGIFGLLMVIALVGGGLGLYRIRGSIFPAKEKAGKVEAAERSLEYSLNVQKMRNGKPYEQSFQTSGREIFENGWKFQLNISSPQEGYLYLLNEGPAAGEVITYNLLFPEDETNNGSARVAAAQKLETAWMRFDEHQGTEKFWIVWAASPVKELDDVTGAVNEKDRGEIKNPDQAKAVRDFLTKHSTPEPEVVKDSQRKLTTVKGKSNVLVSFVELEHH
jgi:hypothetical protein